MNRNAWQMISVLAAVLSVHLAPLGACRGKEPVRTGELTQVLVDLESTGKARAVQALSWLLEREAVTHFTFMATDSRGGTGGGGWYRPSRSQYGRDWLRQRFDKNGDGAVSLEEFSGPKKWFESLDKNGDGKLTAEDFAWFGDSALARASAKVKMLFNQIDQDGNGQITAAEWKLWFDKLSGEKGSITQDDLLPLFMDRRPPGAGRRPGTRSLNARLPVIGSYLSGDVGSLSEGPALGSAAPYFTLARADGKGKLDLASHQGKKPLVLIFGSFT